MKLSEFNFVLPKDRIAQTPLRPRDHARLMVLDLKNDVIYHKKFFEIIDYLNHDDTIVLNNTKVFHARLNGNKTTGGKVELLILERLDDFRYYALIKGKKIRVGMEIIFKKNIRCVVEQKLNGKHIVKFNRILQINEIGEMPTPPYIKQKLCLPEMYNTVYAEVDGSVAAPTAGLHFTEKLLEKIRKKCNIAYITLHVGVGTFFPIRSENIEKHKMEKEYIRIDKKNAEIINRTSGSVIAVGTTVVRTLETATKNNRIYPYEGWTDLYIYPGYKFRSGINGLITNFHLPKSTLILLVSAFAGVEKIKRAYTIAIKEKYRFYSFGDAMFIMK